MRKSLSLLLTMVLLLSCLPVHAQLEDGAYQGEARGFGGEVVVRLVLESGAISEVVVDGAKETQGIGAAALVPLAQQILSAQSADIDGVAGATVTSNAAKQAAEAAIAQAVGVQGEAKTAADGTYEGTAFGFMSPITIRVTVGGGQMKAIEVVECHDTGLIGVTAANQLCEAVVSAQSLGVDVIAGATVTSNGFFTALGEAMEAAGADVNALRRVEVPKRAAQSSEMTTQVLVIGAGMAGLCAAIEAAQQGAEVLVLEKEGVFGGSTTRSEGFVMGAGTSIQKEHGIEDTAEAMYADMLSLYADEPTLDATLLKKVVDDSADLIDWLVKNGTNFVEIEAISAIPPRDIRRAHISIDAGNGLAQSLVAAAEKAGVTILLNTPATKILKEGDVVVGAKATNQYGDDITIRAGATVLCAGSYGDNRDMIARLNPDITAINYSGCGDGDGWTLAEEAGAKMQTIGYVAGSFMYFPYGYWDGAATLPGSPTKSHFNTIQVNAKGARLVNEDAFTFDFGDPLFDSGDKYGWSVVGKTFTDRYPELAQAGKDVEFLGHYITYTADTLEELAALTGMDGAILTETVNRYNASCDAGVDEEFGKDPKYMERVDAPFTAYMLANVISDGYSGCEINADAQVLGQDGSPIPGFYAAGACALPQIIGNRYFGCGSLIMTCGTMGRAAAQHAVKTIA